MISKVTSIVRRTLHTAVNPYEKGSAKRITLGDALQQYPLQNTSKAISVQKKADKVTSISSKSTIASLFGGEYRQQLEAVSSNVDQQEINVEERRHNLDLFIALSSLSLSIGGILIAPTFGLLSLPGILYGSRTIFTNAYQTIVKERRVNMDVLNAIIVTMFIGTGHFVLGNMPVALTALRRKLINKIKDESRSAIIDVFRQQPNSVWALVNGVETEIPSSELTQEHTLVVNAGEVIAVDGVIIEGNASIDQHILTGESQPVEKDIGDLVFALTIVLTGCIYIQVEKTGEETTAAQIGQTLNRTVDFKTNTQLQAEETVDRMILPTLLLGGLSLPAIGASGAMAVLQAPPVHNTTIASAIGMLNYLNLASQQGILIKDGRTLDLLNQVDTVVFDKTGTLTEELPHVEQIHTYTEIAEDIVLRYAAAAECKQTHPIAQAILTEATTRNLSLPPLDHAEYKIGYGISVSIEKQVVHVGSRRFIEMQEITIPQAAIENQIQCHTQGDSLIFVAIDSAVVGAIELRPTLRPEVKDILCKLRQRHAKSLVIISGDHEEPTKRLADELGIDQYFAEALPKQKAEIVKQLQQAGKSVCFIGDGVNDSIALKTAHVSISLQGASTVATDTAHVVLMDQSLRQLSQLFDLAAAYKSGMALTFRLIFVPAIIGISGVFLFHFGFVTVVLLNQLGFLTSLVSTTLPLLSQQGKKHKK